MGDDGGGDGVSRNSNRRRTAKQERALYQPGKGFGGAGSGGGNPKRADGGPRGNAGCAGATDPMDAVQQKLREMEMRGPPPGAFSRSSGMRRDQDEDDRYRQRHHRDRGDYRRCSEGKANVDSTWRNRNDRESTRRTPSRQESRENFHNFGSSTRSQRDSFRNSPRDFGFDEWDPNHRRRQGSRGRGDNDRPKKYLWHQDDKPNARGRVMPNRSEDFGGSSETDRRYLRDRGKRRPLPRGLTNQRRSSEDEFTENLEPLRFKDTDEPEEDEVSRISSKDIPSPGRIDWSECPTPPPPTQDEPPLDAPKRATSQSTSQTPPKANFSSGRTSISPGGDASRNFDRSAMGHGSSQRRRLDSDASNWSQNSGPWSQTHRERHDRKGRDGSREDGRSNARYRSPRNSRDNRRTNETLPPRFQKQKQAQRKMLEQSISGGWERQETRGAARSEVDSSGRNRTNSTESRAITKHAKPLMSVRPVPHVKNDSRSNSGAMQRNYREASQCEIILHQDHYVFVPPHHPALYTLLQRNGTLQLREAISKNLQEAQELEAEIAAQLPRCVQIADGIAQLADLRSKIKLRYEHVVLNDPRFSAEKNIEQLLWKSVYHQIIEALRREIDFGVRTPEGVRSEICEIVEEGSTYYEGLLEQLQALHGFKLDDILQSDQPHVLGSVNSMKMVIISAQKMLICLGDLCRYREQALDSANFAKARDYYLKAQQLAPKNGKPYNQLALLAVYSRRKLDAVYYYMRSLAVSNPFLTAKESLTTLFDEVRKKYEAQEKLKKQLEAKKNNAHMALPEQARCEIWIRPDGSSWQRRGDSELEQKLDMIEELNAMSDFDLLKRFTSSFLHVHGKLFSKIGMDHFSDAAQQMMIELKCLLKKTLGPGGGARYLQLLAICIFSVANNSLKNAEALDSNARSLMQEHSVQIAMSYVTHLMERCTERIDEYLRQRAEADERILPDDVEELLPVLKIWTDWMSGHKMLWCPPPNICDFSTSTKGDVWSAMADLLNALQLAESLRSEELSKIFSAAVSDSAAEEVVLPEDNTMAGFVPLLNSPIDPFLAGPVPPEHREAFRTMVRINRLNFFADYLCGMKKPYLSYDVYRRTYGSLIVDNGRQDEDCGGDEDNLDVEYESQTGSSEHSENEDSNVVEATFNDEAVTEVDKLRRKKQTLQKRMRHKNRVDAYIERVLNHNRGTTILEIRPRYLIPDTNCLVDHLELIQRLVACKKFSIYIPIVVVNELDGLARGTKNNSGARAHQDPEHAARVTAFAHDALAYLREMFNAREPKLRTITSRGNLLDSIAFRTETGTENVGTNDDLILSCAVSLCKEQQLQPGETEAPLKLFREAVLLTADRNLAVKAISHNVPVRDLASFVRWAQVPRLDQR